MANEAVTKVFHAARQDIEIIFHLGELIPHPVFDTQVAAMVCGFGDSVSYDQLVQKVTGAHLDKSSRFTDWRHRPLSDKQLDYALADVTHLIDVYHHLKAELERENRAHWLNEEMEVLTSRETYDPHPEDAWKRLKMRLRKPQELAVVQAVAAWREREARERNVPRGRVLKDDAIYEIAQQQPRDAAALGRLRTTPKGWERSATAGACCSAWSTRRSTCPRKSMPKLPRLPQPPEGSSAAAELLKVLLRMVAEKEGVAAKVLASSDDIDRHRLRRRGRRRAGAAWLAARGVRRPRPAAGPRRDRAQIRPPQDRGVRHASRRTSRPERGREASSIADRQGEIAADDPGELRQPACRALAVESCKRARDDQRQAAVGLRAPAQPGDDAGHRSRQQVDDAHQRAEQPRPLQVARRGQACGSPARSYRRTRPHGGRCWPARGRRGRDGRRR